MEDSSISSEEAILASNKSAVENIRKEKYDHAMFFLNQALLAARAMPDSDKKQSLLAMTYNNLGCYLKRANKLSQALEYFIKASDLSRTYDANIANLTCSHLNISKIYSEQGEHEKALRHGLKSLFLLRHNFSENNTLVSSLIIAYQTVGIEYQFLNQILDSIECFETGLALSVKHLGKNHEVTLALKKSLRDASGKSLRSHSNQSNSHQLHHLEKNKPKKKNYHRGRSAIVPKPKIESKKENRKIFKVSSKIFEPKLMAKMPSLENFTSKYKRVPMGNEYKLKSNSQPEINTVKKSLNDSTVSSEKPVKRNYLINRRADISLQMNSLIKIQSFARMVRPRLFFLKQKRACVKIKKVYKGYLIRKLFQAIRCAVIFIQYMFRKYRSRIKRKLNL